MIEIKKKDYYRQKIQKNLKVKKLYIIKNIINILKIKMNKYHVEYKIKIYSI